MCPIYRGDSWWMSCWWAQLLFLSLWLWVPTFGTSCHQWPQESEGHSFVEIWTARLSSMHPGWRVTSQMIANSSKAWKVSHTTSSPLRKGSKTLLCCLCAHTWAAWCHGTKPRTSSAVHAMDLSMMRMARSFVGLLRCLWHWLTPQPWTAIWHCPHGLKRTSEQKQTHGGTEQ